MDDNKLVIYFFKCQYFKLGLLLKPLEIHSILLQNHQYSIPIPSICSNLQAKAHKINK
jgi:hypothetical protein